MKLTIFAPPAPSPPKNNNKLWNKSPDCDVLSTVIHPSDPMKDTYTESNDPFYRIMNK